jgi:hypothetical protein
LTASEQHAGTSDINDKLEKETALKKKTKKGDSSSKEKNLAIN